MANRRGAGLRPWDFLGGFPVPPTAQAPRSPMSVGEAALAADPVSHVINVVANAGTGGCTPLAPALPTRSMSVPSASSATTAASPSSSQAPLAPLATPAAAAAAAPASIPLALQERDEPIDVHRARHGHAVASSRRPLRRVVASEEVGCSRDPKKGPGVCASTPLAPMPGGFPHPLYGGGSRQGRRAAAAAKTTKTVGAREEHHTLAGSTPSGVLRRPAGHH